jgi:spore coat polysaccharide biosynthesis protein SpsF
MQSTRLFGKVMKPIMGRPMLELMIERLQRVRNADGIVVATSAHMSCDLIANLCHSAGVNCYRGSETDVLDRVLKAGREFKADLLVQLTGDCPLICPGVIQKVINAFHNSDRDYCSNVLTRTYPRGMDTQVYPLSVLEKVAQLTQDPVDHEHVSLYIYSHPEIFNLLNVENDLHSGADIRLTVDTPEDFQLVTHIYEALYPSNPAFSLTDILDFLKDNPKLLAINQHIVQKAVS